MANKFDSFLKDTDLNKKFLLWNKWNFTPKVVGEVRKQCFLIVFLDQHSSGTVSSRMKKFPIIFFCLKYVPSGEPTIIQTDQSHSPFLCKAKHQKRSRSQDTCSAPSLSTQRFCRLNSHFFWTCWREKCHYSEQPREESGENKKKKIKKKPTKKPKPHKTNQNLGYWK